MTELMQLLGPIERKKFVNVMKFVILADGVPRADTDKEDTG